MLFRSAIRIRNRYAALHVARLEPVGPWQPSPRQGQKVAWRAVAYSVFGLAFAVELVLVAPYLARAVSMLARSDAKWVVLAIVAELASMNAAAQVQRRMLASAGVRVSSCRMTPLTYVANALNMTLPAGTAVSAGYVFRHLRTWGASAPAAGFAVLASGALSVTAFGILTAVGVGLAGGAGLSSIGGLAAVVALVATLTVLARRRPGMALAVTERVLVRVNQLVHRAPTAGVDALHRLGGELGAIHPRRRDWAVGLGEAGLNWLADLVCLLAAAHAIGVGHLGLATATLAYVAGMGTASLSPLPGGFGPADAAMIVTLGGGALPLTSATAAVLMYRLVSVVLVVAMGWMLWAAGSVRQRRHASVPPPVS